MVAGVRAIFYGILIWVAVFIVAMAVFSYRESNRPLFESIMPVAVTAATVFFAQLYFTRVEKDFLKEGVMLGLVWLAINLLIDLPMMFGGPLEMTLAEYFADVGLTYLIIPVITLSTGLASARVARRRAKA